MITVRFAEYERYDINIDDSVVRFMATTSKGSYHAEAVVNSARTHRELRARFRERAIEAIQSGKDPCELWLEEYDG